MRSFQTRRRIGNNGIRTIDRSDIYEQRQNEQGFWAKILKWGKSFKNWLSSNVMNRNREVSFQEVAENGVATFQGLWEFNWDISDEQIDKTIIGLQGTLIDRTAGLLGNLAGKLLCGGLPILGIAMINRAAAVHIARTQGVQMLTELSEAFGDYIREVFKNYMRQKTWQAYKNVRRAIKSALLNDNPISKKIVSLIPGGKKTLEAWGDENVEDWSFQAQFQKQIEKLPEDYNGDASTIINQSSVQEFVDSFSDSCEDAIIAVAAGLDDFLGLQKLEEERDRQLVQTTIRPDGRDGEEITIVTSARNQVSGIADALNTHRMLESRDMGSYLGQPWDEIPITESLGIQLTFVFYNFEKPPYYSKKRRNELAKTQIVLPNVKRNMINWERLKNDFGKISPFTKGSVKVTCNLSNGRHFAFYAKSESDGRDMCEKLVEYTDQKIVYPIRFANHEGRGKNKKAQYIKRQKMYLAFVYVLNWEKINKFEEAKVSGTEENYKDPRKAKAKIIMHYDKKPSYVDDLIRQATRSSLELKSTNNGR
ncbi:MAG: hypothetical protein ACP5D6_09850 [Kosmotogaceae bacterium]